jgi:hypothetical protein
LEKKIILGMEHCRRDKKKNGEREIWGGVRKKFSSVKDTFLVGQVLHFS